MQTVSETYRAIWSDPDHRKEHKAEIAGVTYGEDVIVSPPIVSRTLFEGGNAIVGNCIAGQLTLNVIPQGDIPRMAEIKLYTRLAVDTDTGDVLYSEWLPKGTFYIDTRKLDPESGVLSIKAFDAMLKGELQFLEEGDTGAWPRSSSVIVRQISNRMGISVDESTVLSDTVQVPYPNDWTCRELLGYIAAAHCGNWTVTDAGQLRLVPLWSIRTTSETDIGRELAQIETAPAFAPFSKVIAWYDDEHAFMAGDDTGRRLEVNLPFAIQAIVDGMLERIRGYEYQPWYGSSAVLDPAAELGDAVRVNGLYSVLASVETIFDALTVSDAAAPEDEEVDHEYQYVPPTTRAMRRKMTLGADYHGVNITRAKGLEVTQYTADGTARSRAQLNGDVFAMYDDNGTPRLYFDPETGRYKFVGDLDISGGSINMSGGTINWGENNPADGSGISASQARTIISQELVKSPNIAGGKFWDIDQTTWLEMATPTNNVAYLHQYADIYSRYDPVCAMGYYSNGVTDEWVIAPFNKVRFGYSNTYDRMYGTGNWDFSQASVTGLYLRFS